MICVVLYYVRQFSCFSCFNLLECRNSDVFGMLLRGNKDAFVPKDAGGAVRHNWFDWNVIGGLKTKEDLVAYFREKQPGLTAYEIAKIHLSEEQRKAADMYLMKFLEGDSAMSTRELETVYSNTEKKASDMVKLFESTPGFLNERKQEIKKAVLEGDIDLLFHSLYPTAEEKAETIVRERDLLKLAASMCT